MLETTPVKSKQDLSGSEKTYANTTLGTTQKPRVGELKVLGVRQDVGTDHFVMNFSEIAYLASDLQPTKRKHSQSSWQVLRPTRVHVTSHSSI